MHVLALDTSTYVGSVAVVSEGALRAEISARVRAKHGEVLLGHVEQTLAISGLCFAEIGLVAVGLGPGSFTGTRIGVATAKGLALGGGVPLSGVGSLRVLARGLGAEGVAVPMVDAHKGELYVAAYRLRGGAVAEELVAPAHARPDVAVQHVREAIGDVTPVVCGDGLRQYAGVVREHFGAFVEAPPVFDVPRASLLALEAIERYERDGASDLAAIEPTYVRPSDATLPKRPLRID